MEEPGAAITILDSLIFDSQHVLHLSYDREETNRKAGLLHLLYIAGTLWKQTEDDWKSWTNTFSLVSTLPTNAAKNTISFFYLQGHTSDSQLPWCLPGLPGPFLLSCPPAG